MTNEHFFDWDYSANSRAKVRFAEFGAATAKPPMLFIHGYGAMLEHWNLNIPAFESERKIYAMDLLGFGGSDKPNTRYGLALWARQIKAFLDHKNIDQIILIGHSMGGASSLWFANENPDRLKSLVLIDPSGIFADEVSPLEKVMYRAVASPFIGEAMFGLFANRLGAKQSLVSTYFNTAQVTDELVEQFTKPMQSAGAMNAYLAPSRNPDRFMFTEFPRPCNYTGDALLVWGEFDQAFPPQRTIPKFLEIVPQAETAVIPKTKHCPHHELADEVNAALKTFLEKTETTD
jgi:pimeloyl-ACP methyl ester carboxylesterase